jgi:uncharacterized membrane protein YqhA
VALSRALRLAMLGAVAATAVIAVTLIAYGAVETYHLVVGVVRHETVGNAMLFAVVEIVDTFLLALVIQVVSLGIYQLFIDAAIPVPAWLQVADLDDLKAKLVSVVITMLGVFFLGRVFAQAGGQDILWLGLAIAAVIVALALFLNVHFRHGERH